MIKFVLKVFVPSISYEISNEIISILYSKFSFWIPRAIAKFCIPRLFLNREKDIPVLVGTIHRKPGNPEMRRMYAQ